MFYTIYKTTNLLNGKFYIGKHQTNDPQDDYLGSGKVLKAAVKKYGKENFKKEILLFCATEAEMNAKEKELVVLSEDSYNICEGGQGGFGYINREIWNDDRRLDHNRSVSPFKNFTQDMRINFGRNGGNETHRLYGSFLPNWTNKRHTKETKLKMSLSHKGLQDGVKNSQYGTMWITNGTENKKIKKEDLDKYQELGYNKGRTS